MALNIPKWHMIAGKYFAEELTFTLRGVAEVLTSATITATVLDADKDVVLIAATSQSSGATGASWGTGVVVFEFGATATDDVTASQDGWVRINITLGGVPLTYLDVPIWIEKA